MKAQAAYISEFWQLCLCLQRGPHSQLHLMFQSTLTIIVGNLLSSMEQETKENPSSHNGHPIAPYIISGNAPTQGLPYPKCSLSKFEGYLNCQCTPWPLAKTDICQTCNSLNQHFTCMNWLLKTIPYTDYLVGSSGLNPPSLYNRTLAIDTSIGLCRSSLTTWLENCNLHFQICETNTNCFPKVSRSLFQATLVLATHSNLQEYPPLLAGY